MSEYIHCDKCDKVIKTENDLKMMTSFHFDGKRYDLCKVCSEMFYEWIKIPPFGFPWINKDAEILKKMSNELAKDIILDDKKVDELLLKYYPVNMGDIVNHEGHTYYGDRNQSSRTRMRNSLKRGNFKTVQDILDAKIPPRGINKTRWKWFKDFIREEFPECDSGIIR